MAPPSQELEPPANPARFSSGWIAPNGLAHLDTVAALIADPAAVPEGVRAVCTVLLDGLAVLDRQIALLDREIARRARED